MSFIFLASFNFLSSQIVLSFIDEIEKYQTMDCVDRLACFNFAFLFWLLKTAVLDQELYVYV